MSSEGPRSTPRADERFHRRRIRQILGAMAGLALVGGLGGGLAAAVLAPGAIGAALASSARRTGTTADAVTAVRAFAASLDSTQTAALAGPTGTGVRLGELDPDQRAAAFGALEAALSPEGYAQLAEAMAADDELDAASGGGTEWSSDRYTIALLSDADGFFFQFGGTQVAVNANYRDGVLIVEPEVIDA